MTPALKSFLLCSCLCVSGVLAAAQATTCAADGDEARGSAIGCVTGEGVVVKSDTGTAAQTSEVLPLTPEQRPATPPIVIFENGKLSITAKNATLSDILLVVGEKTGAAIDVPEAANERVVSQLGPGAPRDVIAALLNGSHYNYVVLGNEADPNAVARVVLTAKGDHGDGAGTPVDPTALAARARGMMQPRALQQAMQAYQQQEQAQEPTVPDFQQAQVRAAAVQEPAAPKDQASVTGDGGSPASASGGGATETAAADPASAGTGNQTNSTAEKTPQQMLQDLYETRRQMMQQTQQQRVAQQQPQDQPAQQ